jgi:uncharacterized protein involved in type VI secretion and phage assembly
MKAIGPGSQVQWLGMKEGLSFIPKWVMKCLWPFNMEMLNYPYVIGALWNGQDKPPETNADGKNNIRKIRSRSGHELIFNDDDKNKQEKIEIHTKGGHKIILDDSSGKEKIEIVDKSGNNKIIIDSVQKSIAMESAMKLTIKANMVEIEGSTSLTLRSNATLTIQGMPVKIN